MASGGEKCFKEKKFIILWFAIRQGLFVELKIVINYIQKKREFHHSPIPKYLPKISRFSKIFQNSPTSEDHCRLTIRPSNDKKAKSESDGSDGTRISRREEACIVTEQMKKSPRSCSPSSGSHSPQEVQKLIESYDGPVTTQYSGVKIRGIRILGPEQDLIRKPWRLPRSSLGYIIPGLDDSKPENYDIVKVYFKKWKSKTLYQTLLLFRAKMFLDLTNFCQQVHLYNVNVFSQMTACKIEEYVELDCVGKKLRYDSFIGEHPPKILRMPFVLNHRSNFYSEKLISYDPDPFCEKRQIFKDDRDWINLIKVYTRIPRHRFITDKNEYENYEDEKPEDAYDERITTEMRRFMGRDSLRSISVYSVEVPDTPNRLYDNGYGKPHGISLTKTFMQYMCPSCCGGLFSEPKGSVYTKRQRGIRPSETTSVDTIISIDDTEKKSEARHAEFSTSVDTQRQKAQENVITEEISDRPIEFREIEQVDEEDEESNLNNVQPSNRQNDPQISSTNDKHSEHDSKFKLERNTTIREELHMYSKELTERVTKEISCEPDSGEIRWGHMLRKTSYPNNEVTDDTVVELKIGGKDHVEVRKQNGDNEAPFDFQAFLRKTNTTRQSLRRFSDISTNFADETFVITELLPNIVLEGTVYNL